MLIIMSHCNYVLNAKQLHVVRLSIFGWLCTVGVQVQQSAQTTVSQSSVSSNCPISAFSKMIAIKYESQVLRFTHTVRSCNVHGCCS